MKKIIFTGGGTVGHVTLNLLLIPKFLEDGWQVHYIGDAAGIEYQQIIKSGLDIQFHPIATGKLRRYFSWQNALDIFKVGWGILQSLFVMAKVRPQALFSKGGFVSVPPVIAARALGIPVFIHESDLSMGLANKIAYKFATTMYSTFEQTAGLEKVVHVGAVTKVAQSNKVTPIQLPDILRHFDEEKPVLLLIGGSGGAKVFNDFISSEKKALTQLYNIINITGHSDLNELSDNLYRVDYVTDLYFPLLAQADLVVTRGGSNTLFELVAGQKLHAIVPLGKQASRGDQLENAAYFEEKGYAKQWSEEDLTMERFPGLVEEIFQQKDHYLKNMEESTDIQSLEAFYERLKSDIGRRSRNEG
ncbi:UDP-N-acetylglucosamine--N-acetylmuramyl-(pentapeptide) pyrophosphoryl-undecaprenol N-acetylglucosamine transferase [Streptococcus suis]|uniref:UDP-N-acetylglucosamine--N-acetylmuramyl-(Pentapeptide) pyrophosphoryl-undecaprenol N-acetylglucosamine transferase n=1 Tax=Streptococcus suivaginalis TaxID=3028082 RepID=A0AA96VG41_9STRE|nr:UDP-N-acetylglucosamine--N-acetylmuramyl-(pentapeptide) pyrophosphoryl-undecaprenol N-acetylglucosamine transferase [Streptococcus sp. 29896]MCK4028536.1 UDP-N-acetylglucosamine--N-acetylmuramyl-(pentapeptide) pyrophosphoryl-undecaprenol N-acetylglucosamine transferase [Streptococcus suis]WNY47558.1 UDP-N-acetylglucosamine--N-acetylmuramyl-(pentapeptide) pyrophosphoryl-undecaprenol N-acetylglucosamine transferase [Streptococcus sp. 29896]